MNTGTTSYTPETYTPQSSHSWTDRCCSDLSRAVEENPAGSLLTAFGAGLGIGVALGLSVAFSTARPKSRNRAEELGHRILESIQDLLPDSLARRIG